MSKKYTATFTCDYGLWIVFKKWAKKQNSSASEQISNFMHDCTFQGKEIDNLYENKENFELLLREIINEELDKREEEKEKTKADNDKIITEKSTKNLSNTESTDNTEDLSGNNNTDNTWDTDSFSDTEDTESMGNTDKVLNANESNSLENIDPVTATTDTDNTENTDRTLNTEDTENTDKNPSSKEIEPGGLLTDGQLKKQEKLNCAKSTITRWRQGKGNIPENIASHYKIVGTKWKFIGEN